MKRILFTLGALAIGSIALADEQADQQKAFNDGKAYKSQNAGVAAAVNNSSLQYVPGQDPNGVNQLQSLYGQNTAQAGADKVTVCATYVPGSDAYKNQDCGTINYLVRNKTGEPTYTIDKKYDPLVVQGNTIRNAPQGYTQGASGLSGNYTGCVDKLTHTPIVTDTERCEIGHEVTLGSCPVIRVVTYTWEFYVGQAGADMRYAKCNDPDIRGDLLTGYPQVGPLYTTTQENCSPTDTAKKTIIWRNNCDKSVIQHGYDGTLCTPSQGFSDPPHEATQLCVFYPPHDNEFCFKADGTYSTLSIVPVFVDTLDDSACVELNTYRAKITN